MVRLHGWVRNARPHQGGLACGVYAMQREDVLCQIDSCSDNSYGFFFVSELMKSSRSPWSHVVAARRNARLARDGDVPSIC